MQATRSRKIWQHDQVVDAAGPSYTLRTYLEQSDIRAWLKRISRAIEIRSAADLGAGYGRLTPVLLEFAPYVVAFEREPHFVEDIVRLLPHVEARQVRVLSQLPAPARTFDVVLAFTVLQHLDDDEVVEVAAELKRVLSPSGYVVLCEETDPSLRFAEHDSPEGGVTIGRSIEQYQALLSPLHLVSTAPRRMEPTYRANGGAYMLFRG